MYGRYAVHATLERSMIKKLSWIPVVFVLSCAWPATAAKVTIDDLMRLRSLSEVRISPDGKQVAYVVSTPSFETAAHEAVLYVVPSTGGTPLRLTHITRIFNRPVPAPALRWSPDGTLLSFIGFVDGVPQVMVMSSAGGEASALTSVKEGVTNYEWAPDGKRFAFLAPDPPSPEEEQRRKDKSYVIHVDRSERFPRLWVQDARGGTAKVISPANQFVIDFNWAPDGQAVVYSASNESGFNARYRTQIYVIAATGGEPRTVVARPGTNRAGQYSPDGRWIAFISTGGYKGMIAAQDLYVVSADGRPGTIRNLTAAKEAWIGEFTWAPDSRSIFYIPDEQTSDSGEHMFEQPIGRVSLDGGRIDLVTPGRVVNFSLSLSKDGTEIAYKCVQSRTMGDVYVMNLSDGRTVRLTEINPELRGLELGELKPIHWKSFDGKEIWGLLLTPPGYKPGTRIPLVVYCHGGPIGGFTYGIFPQFMHRPGQVDPYPSEAMASAGMAILFPMPRGGSGYGIAGFRAIINRWGEDDYKDIMAGVDYLLAQGIADPERLGVMGASYGGFMTNWIVTHTDRFKAASTGCSVSDLVQEYYLSDAGDFMVEYFGLPWEDADALVAHSPITFVQNVKTPLLIQHGEEDHRVPLSQAREFYKALKALHKTVEFDIYPRGGHVNYEPPLEREYLRRNLEWFTKWLIPGSAGGEPVRSR
jgi:dipeptidyl aminopeptidase/acylaminoacyl peptidase